MIPPTGLKLMISVVRMLLAPRFGWSITSSLAHQMGQSVPSRSKNKYVDGVPAWYLTMGLVHGHDCALGLVHDMLTTWLAPLVTKLPPLSGILITTTAALGDVWIKMSSHGLWLNDAMYCYLIQVVCCISVGTGAGIV